MVTAPAGISSEHDDAGEGPSHPYKSEKQSFAIEGFNSSENHDW